MSVSADLPRCASCNTRVADDLVEGRWSFCHDCGRDPRGCAEAWLAMHGGGPILVYPPSGTVMAPATHDQMRRVRAILAEGGA